INFKRKRPNLAQLELNLCSTNLFQLEEHLVIHRHKHEMTLKFPSIKTDAAFTDQTPTPSRFLQNCDEVGLFKEIEEEFLQAQEEEEKNKRVWENKPQILCFGVLEQMEMGEK
uniref:Uncharacterized protein n=1 Tax=Gouania willdenowi TaxID=441366 RepID=A0A8C5E9G2_GOUWI